MWDQMIFCILSESPNEMKMNETNMTVPRYKMKTRKAKKKDAKSSKIGDQICSTRKETFDMYS